MYWGQHVNLAIVIKKVPFKIQEEGWGEFDMEIVLSAVDKGGDHALAHDLNFQTERYEAKHPIVGLHKMSASLEGLTLIFCARPSKTLSQAFWPHSKNQALLLERRTA